VTLQHGGVTARERPVLKAAVKRSRQRLPLGEGRASAVAWAGGGAANRPRVE